MREVLWGLFALCFLLGLIVGWPAAIGLFLGLFCVLFLVGLLWMFFRL